MKKIWIIVFVIILIIVVVVLNNNKKDIENSEVNSVGSTMPVPGSTVDEKIVTPVDTASEVEFTVSGGNFYFKPNIMRVKEGDTVTITFKNSDGFHDFKIDELGVATSQIKSGAEEKVTFVASKKGSFEYYCSVGEHRKNGMKGTLIVE